MIKELKKIIIMSVTLLLLVVGLVLVLTMNIDFGIFKNLSIANISVEKDLVEALIVSEKAENAKHAATLEELDKVKTQYDAAKDKFEKIDESTLELVEEATTDEKYFIEYLWIVLGNYARDNNLMINIITPGSTSAVTGGTEESGKTESAVDPSVKDGSIKLIVSGRYADVADFVYEVENDKELKFKLDNIKMSYTKNNAITATFNVLSLKVKK